MWSRHVIAVNGLSMAGECPQRNFDKLVDFILYVLGGRPAVSQLVGVLDVLKHTWG